MHTLGQEEGRRKEKECLRLSVEGVSEARERLPPTPPRILSWLQSGSGSD